MEGSSRSAVVVRPMGVGEVLDTGLKLARKNYRLLLITTAWAVVPAFVIGAILSLVTGLSGFATGLTSLGAFLATIALIVACSHLIAPTGMVDELAPGPLYRVTRSRIWTYILWSLLVFVLAIPLVILFPLGIYLGVRWFVSGISLVTEGDGPVQSLRRSWNLTKGAWWHTFWVLFVFGVLYGLLLTVVSSIFVAISGVLTFGGATLIGSIVSALGSAVGTIVAAPIAAAIEVVLYYELRARREGFDLSSQAGQQWQSQ